MVNIIDRRPNPKGKSLPNRQKFIRRSKDYITDSIKKNIKDANIDGIIDNGGNIKIPAKGIKEYRFRHSSKGGEREYVLPGNEHYEEGDTIPKPGGEGKGKGKKGSDSGDGEDDFQFVLTRDEFLDIFFEDLDLPNLVKKQLKEIKNITFKRAGYTTVGSPTNINIIQSLRNSIGRRIALRRPKHVDIDILIKEKEDLEELVKVDPSEENIAKLRIAEENVEKINRKLKFVPYIDPLDIRYNCYAPHPEPNTKAVMFCVMDVSGSMGEREKDLAKRFFILLYLFLERRYDKIDLVFIRHTQDAKEVDEKEFFYSKETGGTIVSTGLVLMEEIIRERYPTTEWNIYAAQASDGENFNNDSTKCYSILTEKLMKLIQYYAYIEITNDRPMFPGQSEDDLWGWYQKVAAEWKNFSMAKISKQQDIFPVFRKLFSKDAEVA